jgi:multimeric flavodoxin WrbA
MKNVLIVSSSPRKGGNSDTLCDKFLEGAQSAGNKVEKIFLKDKKINHCTGCGFCNTNDYTACSQKDDMSEILDKMQEADVIVFGTPIYFYSMCGQMKTFIDRLCARYTHLKGKEFYYIMTAADTSQAAAQFALGEFRGLMACLDSPVEKAMLFAGGVWQKGEVDSTVYIQQAFDMGKAV